MKIKNLQLTKVSTKGQIVIPQNLRYSMKIKEGSLFAIVQPAKNTIVLKKLENLISKEDMDIVDKIERAWNEIEKGRYKKYTVSNFLKKLGK